MKARITNPIEPYKRDDTLLRIRVDFIPDIGDPLYEGCHIQVPERGLTEGERLEWNKCETDECRDELLIKWGIAKVWRTNPINCHFFYLPIGFTQDDLDKAISSRLVSLKEHMTGRALGGYTDLSIDDLPRFLQKSPALVKGEGQALPRRRHGGHYWQRADVVDRVPDHGIRSDAAESRDLVHLGPKKVSVQQGRPRKPVNIVAPDCCHYPFSPAHLFRGH